MSDVAAFEVITPTGHKFQVFENGKIAGFGDEAIIINRIPAIKLGAKGESSTNLTSVQSRPCAVFPRENAESVD